MKTIQPIPTLLITLLLLATACQSEEQADVTDEETLVRTVNVNVVEITPGEFNSYIRMAGNVTTSNDVHISAEVSGRVMNVLNREGVRISEGESILKIDDRRLLQEIRRLEAQTEQSRENFERLQNLYNDQNIGSEIDVINARSTFEQNQASLEALRVDLEHTTITAPFDGIVEDISVEAGEMVAPGTEVARMISQSGLKLTIGVPARYANAVDIGDMAEVWFDFAPEEIHSLPVTFIGNSIDPNNRTFRAELEFPTGMEDIKVEMLANVRLRTMHIDSTIVVSEEFILNENGGSVAYVTSENENGQPVAEQRILSTGPASGSQIVVNAGLEPGDYLITVGSAYLQNGTRINIVTPTE